MIEKGIGRQSVVNGKFNDVFKNAMRDYYTYGFKNYKDYKNPIKEKNRALNTVKKDWDRLNSILCNYFEWSDNNNEVIFASKNTRLQEEKENPLHLVYRFCHCKPEIAETYITILFLMCPFVESDFADYILDTSEYDRAIKGIFKTSTLVTLTGRDSLVAVLSNLKNLGVICDKRKEGLDDHLWSISKCTVGDMIRHVELNEKEEYCKLFNRHLADALTFYARYLPFGEIGAFILERCGYEYSSLFRFKHDYLIAALYDYNRIDILYAIEHKQWCIIEYKHAMTLDIVHIVLLPIEIRCSVIDGREFLIGYDPSQHSCLALRIDFIDSVNYIKNLYDAKTDKSLEMEIIYEEINNAKDMLKNVWETSVARDLKEKQETLSEIRLTIAFDTDKEQYIYDRISAECRFGTYSKEKGHIYYSVYTYDSNELIPWIRSFYTRVEKIDGIKKECFSVAADVAGIKKLYDEKDDDRKNKMENRIETAGFKELDNTKAYRFKYERNKEIIKEPHGQLFNEIFSMYFMSLGRQTIKSSGDNNYALKRYKSKWKQEIDFLKDVLPLTFIERRWLLTMLNDSRINMFLSENETKSLIEVISNGHEIDPFNINDIFYYDRYKNIKNSDQHKINTIGNLLMKAMNDQKKVVVIYKRAEKMELMPIKLEYSKRNDSFQVYFLRSKGKQERAYVKNLEEIEDIKILEKSFNYFEAEKHFQNMNMESYTEPDNPKATIVFSGRDILADRILNEFAPWDKKCTYNRDTGEFRLEIPFLKDDEEREIVIRLLRYGSDIKIIGDKGDALYNDYMKRIRTQADLIK